MQPRSTRHRQHAEGDTDGDFAQANRGQAHRAQRIEHGQQYARDAEPQDHRPLVEKQDQASDRGDTQQADAQAGHAARVHDAGLDES